MCLCICYQEYEILKFQTNITFRISVYLGVYLQFIYFVYYISYP